MPIYSPDNFVNILEKALRHLQAGDLDTAKTAYQTILNRVPNHPEALHLLGVIAHQEGNHEKSAELIRQALKFNPDADHYLYNLGEAQYALAHFTEAAKSYRECVRLQPNTAAAWNRLGLIEQKHNFDIKAAEHAYTTALRFQPDFYQVLNNFGLLKLSRLEYHDAGELFRKALTLKPDYAEAAHNLAITLQHLGKIDEAEKFYLQALSLNPELSGLQCQYINLLQNSCSWTKLQKALFVLETRTTRELKEHIATEESPLLHITHSFDMQRNRMIAQRKCGEFIKNYRVNTVETGN